MPAAQPYSGRCIAAASLPDGVELTRMKVYSFMYHVFKGQGLDVNGSSSRALPANAAACNAMLETIERVLGAVVWDWAPAFGALRSEHRLRCSLEHFLSSGFMDRALRFVSVAGTNSYVAARIEHRSDVLVPRFLVRAVPIDVYTAQTQHFMTLLKHSLPERPKAALQPVQQFLFAWTVHCAGFVTSRWLKQTWFLLRDTPAVWHYINGMRAAFRLPASDFKDCAQRLRAAGFTRVKGPMPLLGMAAMQDLHTPAREFATRTVTDEGDCDGDDEGEEGDAGVTPRYLQPGKRVPTKLFRNGSATLPDGNDAWFQNQSLVDCTGWMADARTQAQFAEFEALVLWHVQPSKSRAAQDSPYCGHMLRGLRVWGYVSCFR